jgi:DNA-binding GntR family transcriptional regulator
MSTPARPSLIEISPEAKRPSALPDHVYAILKQRILSCVLPPNQRLIEKTLCEELQVSRTPLREALNRLSHDDLVTFQPHVGYRVAPITLAGFRNLIELRTVVEPEGARLAAERATLEDVQRLRASATIEQDPSDDNSYVDYCRANARFHLNVVRTGRNAMLEAIVMSVLDLYQRPTYLRIGRQVDAKNPSARHHAIVDAIEKRDPEAAKAAMLRHVVGGGERILEALRAENFA